MAFVDNRFGHIKFALCIFNCNTSNRNKDSHVEIDTVVLSISVAAFTVSLKLNISFEVC